MKINRILIFIFFFICLDLRAQDNEADKEIRDYRKRLQEQLERQRKDMEKLFESGDPLDGFNRYFEQMLKNFRMSMEEVDKALEDGTLDSFGNLGLKDNNEELFEWSETDKERMVTIKVKPDEKRPFDLKVEKGMILLTGQVMETKEFKDRAGNKSLSQSLRSFNHAIPVPRDVDENSAKFENTPEGYISIRFQKKKLAAPVPKNKEDAQPVRPDKNDITI